ncbi:hypothetical protein Tco_1352188 [Tanacetum coccineum]
MKRRYLREASHGHLIRDDGLHTASKPHHLPDFIQAQRITTPPVPQERDSVSAYFTLRAAITVLLIPTVESPRYVTESDPEEDPEEYEDDETEDGPESTIL